MLFEANIVALSFGLLNKYWVCCKESLGVKNALAACSGKLTDGLTLARCPLTNVSC